MSTRIPRDALIRDLSAVLAGMLHQSADNAPGRVAACRIRDVPGIRDSAFPSEIRRVLEAALTDKEPEP